MSNLVSTEEQIAIISSPFPSQNPSPENSTLSLYSQKTLEMISQKKLDHTSIDIATMKDKGKFVSLSSDSIIEIDIEGSEKRSDLKLTEISKVKCSPHHKSLAAVSSGKSMKIHDFREGKVKFSIENAHFLNVLDFDFNPNKQYHLLTSGEDALYSLLNFTQGENLGHSKRRFSS